MTAAWVQGSVIKTVQEGLAVAADDPKHDEAIERIRNVTKDWVATYRKGGNYQGRPSYGYALLQPCKDWGKLAAFDGALQGCAWAGCWLSRRLWGMGARKLPAQPRLLGAACWLGAQMQRSPSLEGSM